MKKFREDVDFMYPSEKARLVAWRKRHSRNMGDKALISTMRYGERQSNLQEGLND